MPVNTPFLPPTGNLSLAPEKPLSPPPGQSFFSPPVGQPPPLGTPPPTSLSGPNQQNTAPADIFWGGVFTANGSFIHLVGSRLAIWKSFPKNENDTPLLILGGDGVSFSEKVGFSFLAGDGSGAAWAGSKLYLSLSNGNKIVVFNSLPDKSGQGPDFAVGSPNLNVNTLETAFIISNPAPVSNGKSLFVSSDFDRKLYVWKDLPDESSAKPDFVYSLPEGPWDNALFEEKLALAGKGAVYLWQKLPTEGQKPDQIFNDKIGSIKLQNLNGVALDEKYFYLADGGNNKIYIWEGIPQESSEPKFVLNIDSPGRLSSDGRYLIATSTLGGAGGSVKVYKIDELSNNIQPISLGGPGSFNLPQAATVSHGHLFIGDTGFNRVLIWKNIEDALLGKKADVILGETGRMEKAEEAKPKIGKDKLFWPAIPSFDGSFLWLGEFKFSERILRFSVR
ncbi:MAG: hypothetical protein FJ044_02645 [Candidatus Cloacimonetes bacterium]|nr:hypothetical protein [Candidatus Cloacimonadota bacterium]